MIIEQLVIMLIATIMIYSTIITICMAAIWDRLNRILLTQLGEYPKKKCLSKS